MADRGDPAPDREDQVAYLARELHIPREEASILLEHMEHQDDE